MTARRLLGACVVALVALLGTATPHATAQAQPTIDIIDQTPFVRRGSTFTLRLKVTGAQPNERVMVAVGRVSSDLNRVRQTRADLRKTDRPVEMIAGNVVGIFAERDGARDANGFVTFTIEIGSGGDRVPLEPGVWPVAIGIGAEFRKPRFAIMTQLVVVPDQPVTATPAATPATPPLAVTVVVPITARPALRPDGVVKLDAADRTRLSTIVSRVQALPTAVLAISPQLVDALRSSDNAEDRALLDRLVRLASSFEVLALPYVDVDEEAWRQAALTDELKNQYAIGAARLREGLGVEPTSGTAVVDASATTASLRMLEELGTHLFIFNEDNLDALPSKNWPTPPTKRFQITNLGGVGVTVDPELRRLFVGDSILNAHRLLADLSAAYFDVYDSRDPRVREERHGVVVLVPDDWNASTQFLGVLTDGLRDNPILQPSKLDKIFDLSPAAPGGDNVVAGPSTGSLERTLKPSVARALESYPTQLRETTARLHTVRTMVELDPTVRDRIPDLLLVSGDSRLDPNERAAYLDAVNAYVGRFSRGLSFSKVNRVTLTAQHDKIRLNLDNPLPAAVHVRFEIRSDPRLDFPNGRVFTKTLLQGTNLVEIDVRSRATGDTPVEILVTAPEGDDGSLGVLTSTKVRVRSLALSGVGLGLSVLALAVLLVWWIRNARATRRQRRSAVPSPETVAVDH